MYKIKVSHPDAFSMFHSGEGTSQMRTLLRHKQPSTVQNKQK